MENIIQFPLDDIEYITGGKGEPAIVGIKTKDISIQLSENLHDILLGDVKIKREELIAFALSVNLICDNGVNT